MANYTDSDPTVSLEGVNMMEQQMEADQASDNILNLQGENKMNREEFWKLIDSTLDAENQEEQLGLIKTKLMKLSEAEIVSFQIIIGDLLDESYNWTLWKANSLIIGYWFSDAFFDFRVWLISKGQLVFDNALKNPDLLASHITKRDLDDIVNIRSLCYIASRTYTEKSGKDIWMELNSKADKWYGQDTDDENEILDNATNMASGKGWNFNDKNEIQERFPNLLRKFVV